VSSPIDAVSTYFFAKDGNRPYLMRRAFAEHAELEVVVKTDAISFPDSATGVAAIEDILGRRFAADFENVYTFGLAKPTAANRRHFPCHWLVGMCGRNNGSIRIGCGRYDWYFTPDEPCLVERLIITIDVMSVCPASELDALMPWISALPYPWCTPKQAVAAMPSIEALAPIAQYLNALGPLSPE
jgi:hypothetical protein